jgi:hypothetical protein
MRLHFLVRVISVMLAVVVLGLPSGCGLKASPDKKTGEKSGAKSTSLCDAASTTCIYVFKDGVNVLSPGSVPDSGDDHVLAIAHPGDTVEWHIADPAVNRFFVFFDESPCEAGTDFPPTVYPSDQSTQNVKCTVYQSVQPNSFKARVHKYELIIISVTPKGVIHRRYLDPHIIVAGTGQDL